MNYFENLDGLLVVWVNQHHSPLLDDLFWIISSKLAWLPVYLLLAWLLKIQFGTTKMFRLLLVIVVSVGLADLISAKVVKEQIARSRPSHHTVWGPQLRFHTFDDDQVYKGGAYGFVSNHATNFSAICFWIFLAFRQNRRWVFYAFLAGTLLVGYSRIYLGVHYLSDVLGGYILGTSVAALLYFLTRKINPQWVP